MKILIIQLKRAKDLNRHFSRKRILSGQWQCQSLTGVWKSKPQDTGIVKRAKDMIMC